MAAGLRRQVLWSILAGVVTGSSLILWRGFFWHHALITGLGAAALVYSVQRSTENLRNLYRKRQ